VPRRQSAVWLGRLIAALGVAVALGWLPYQVYGRSGLARLVKLRAELSSLRAESAGLRAANARLRAEVLLHEEDPQAAIERAAREDLGLVKPGEIVFRIEGLP
jgi:cell division protein FtsB